MSTAPSQPTVSPRPPSSEHSRGVAAGVGAYLLWGFLPVFFLLLAPAGPWEVVAARVVFSLLFCLILLTVTRTWRELGRLLRTPRTFWLTGLAGALIYINWQVFVIGALSERILETSLGYFINPIVTVLLGVLVLRERIRRLQWVAVGVAAVAVVVIIAAYGSFPWIALTLAGSFGLYGLVKKKLGPDVGAVTGLSMETIWLMPVAVVQLVLVQLTTGITFANHGGWHAAAMMASGVVTAVPLLLFAAGARRIPLSLIGMIQFMTPIMQFITGALFLHEPLPAARWAGFIIVWVAVLVFVVDMLLAGNRARITQRRRED